MPTPLERFYWACPDLAHLVPHNRLPPIDLFKILHTVSCKSYEFRWISCKIVCQFLREFLTKRIAATASHDERQLLLSVPIEKIVLVNLNHSPVAVSCNCQLFLDGSERLAARQSVPR